MTVTEDAKEELQRIIEERNLEPDKYLRLATPPVWTGPGDWGIVISDEGEGDVLVQHEAQTVLLVDPALAEHMATAVLDFKDTPEGQRFTLDVY